MKYTLPLALLSPGAALAHAGPHETASPFTTVAHVLGSADHLLVLAAVALTGGILALRALRGHAAERVEKDK